MEVDISGSECSICRLTEKLGKHYGAITCYSCRAFFRRAQDRKRAPRCKFEDKCAVDQSVKKQCPKCRYQKCISAGMQPELVLNEEEKNERFKVSINRKILGEPHAYMVETSEIDTASNHSLSLRTTNSYAIPIGSPVSSSPPPSSYSHPNPRPLTMTHLPILARMPVVNVTQTETTNFQQSPSSANMSSNLSSFHAYNQQNLQNIQLSCFKEGDNFNITFGERNQESETEIEFKVDKTLIDLKMIGVDNSRSIASTSNSAGCRVSVIKLLGNKSPCDNLVTSDEKITKFIDVKHDKEASEKMYFNPDLSCPDSEMIWKYIHKKFGKGRHNKISADKKRDLDANLFQAPSYIQTLDNRKRKSVIVHNLKSKLARTAVDSYDSHWNDALELEDGNVHQVNLDIDFASISTLTASALNGAEDCFLDKMKDTFEFTWNEISLGEEIVGDYINFCKNRSHFKLENWIVCNRQFSERYLNFVCSLDIMEEIPMKTLYTLFKKNLGKAQMLTYVFVFNAQTWLEELDFVYSVNDLQQWKTRDPAISGLPLNKMIQFIPLPEEMKLELYKSLYDNCMPVFQDRTVLILLVLIVICDMEGHSSVTRIRQNVYSMLERYLQKTTKNYLNFEMQNIDKCIETLPRLAKLFCEW
eukprot:GFUD01029433.1.p1 GENE.GFUD01029433.1~~GFUD01029433.1.p1  ORF type:complete len:660 (+),score=109.72 GFUD01029433.1:54-1982(+)